MRFSSAKSQAEPTSSGRLLFIFSVLFFFVGLIIFRLYSQQIIEHEEAVRAASIQSTALKSLPAPRGKIFARDADGQIYPLAVSEWRYQVSVSPRAVKNKDRLAKSLAEFLKGISQEEILSKINNDKMYVVITKGLTEAEAQKLNEQDLIGVMTEPMLVRVYPEADKIAAQVLGFVGADGEGKYGVEALYDDELRGKSGSELSKRDSLGRLIDILGREKSQSGQDIVLTIDYNLQFVVENKLKEALEKYQADAGSVVVMNPKDGSIVAMASQPTFDPNNYSALKAEEHSRFLPASVSSVYEPGSVFKPLTMAAAIDQKLVEPTTEGVFGKSVKVLDREIFNAEFKTYGKETMAQVLENSDNVAMVWISSLLGSEKEREYLEKFGFGKKSGVELVGEQSGVLRDIKEWNEVLRSTAAFGQGVSASLLQLTTAYAAIANGGTLVTPHLAEKTMKDNLVEKLTFPSRGQVISAETAGKVREMLAGVVERGHGKRAQVQGVRVGGKTGTAEVPNPAGGYYEDRHIGSFAGLFPVEDPQFVMAVRLDNPKAVQFAESSAAPTFGEIANWIADQYRLKK